MTDSDAPEERAADVPEETTEGSDALAAAVAENPEAVAAFVERLDTVNELLDVAALGGAALDDEMVVRLAHTGTSLGEVADTASEPETVRGLQTVLRALGEAGGEAPGELGAVGTVRALRDPDVKRGLAFLLAVARGIGRDLDPAD